MYSETGIFRVWVASLPHPTVGGGGTSVVWASGETWPGGIDARLQVAHAACRSDGFAALQPLWQINDATHAAGASRRRGWVKAKNWNYRR
jgi:hypothetical protein